MKKTTMRLISFLVLAVLFTTVQAQKGALTPDMLEGYKNKVWENESHIKALQNAVSNGKINELALNRENVGAFDNYFSDKVSTKGITDQQSSGRCWLFTGLNVLRAYAIGNHDMKSLELSQNYNFFFDQLEKANLFLEGIIETAEKPLDDKKVEWLLKNPIGDGGQWTGVVDLVKKYGVVPARIMPETQNSNNTRWLSHILKKKLKKDALELRTLHQKGEKEKYLRKVKNEMLSDIYKILTIGLGEPPTEFTWRYETADGVLTEAKTYTPQSFYEEFIGLNLDDYVMFMNDPSRPYHQLYEIEYDRHTFEGHNWKYINLPTDEIKPFAITSIKGNEGMYFSCDVGKQLNRKAGVLDPNNYQYDNLFAINLSMDKKQRIKTFESGSTHGMMLMAVDLNKEGEPEKWLLENSWGPESGFKGHLIMTDEWFDEYMFRLVVHKKYISDEVLRILDTKPTMLPPWDPMFSHDQ
jgi:bleomycin hydrolase